MGTMTYSIPFTRQDGSKGFGTATHSSCLGALLYAKPEVGATVDGVVYLSTYWPRKDCVRWLKIYNNHAPTVTVGGEPFKLPKVRFFVRNTKSFDATQYCSEVHTGVFEVTIPKGTPVSDVYGMLYLPCKIPTYPGFTNPSIFSSIMEVVDDAPKGINKFTLMTLLSNHKNLSGGYSSLIHSTLPQPLDSFQDILRGVVNLQGRKGYAGVCPMFHEPVSDWKRFLSPTYFVTRVREGDSSVRRTLRPLHGELLTPRECYNRWMDLGFFKEVSDGLL